MSREHEGYEEGAGAPGDQRGLALGFLAMVPLLVLYEFGVAESPEARNTSELVLFRLTSFLGTGEGLARRLLLAATSLWALWSLYRADFGLLPRLGRILFEGVLAAVCLGPLLIGLIHLIGAVPEPVELRLDGPSAPPPMSQAASILGGAAYEELVFRVGVYALLYLFVHASLSFLLTPGTSRSKTAWLAAEASAVLGSSLAFAAFHLETFTAWLGPGGEPFQPAVFTWRALAGILLAVLYRWRGIGVAAWAHAIFNLALFLGAGPDVFL